MSGDQTKVIDVPGETLLIAVIYRDGRVSINTSQSPEWVAAALRDLADSVLVTPASPPDEPAF